MTERYPILPPAADSTDSIIRLAAPNHRPKSAFRSLQPRSTYRPHGGLADEDVMHGPTGAEHFARGRQAKAVWLDSGRWCVLDRAGVSWQGRLARRRKMAFPPREIGIPQSGHREPCAAMWSFPLPQRFHGKFLGKRRREPVLEVVDFIE
jgi:hypothetical protein